MRNLPIIKSILLATGISCASLLLLTASPAQAGSWWQIHSTDTVGSGVWSAQEDNSSYSSPHGGFAASSNLCKTCHAVHMAGEESWRLLKSGNTTESRTQGEMSQTGMGNSRETECMYCHDASSGATSKKPYELTPLGETVRGEHTLGATNIPDSDINGGTPGAGVLAARSSGSAGVLQCYQCHSVHGSDTLGSTSSAGELYNSSDAVESWNTKILRLDPGGDGTDLAKGYGGLSVATWQNELDSTGSAVRTGFCADCHNLNPNWEIDSDDTTRPNPRSHPQGPGTDSRMEVYGVTMTVAAHPLEEMGCRGCHWASVGDDGAGVSRFPHQSTGWKLLFDEATMTGGTTDLAGDPNRIIPKMDVICLSCHAVFSDLDVASGTGMCLNCHDSKYGAPDIGDEIRKAYGMGIQDVNFASHEAPAEGSADFAEGNRHAQCDDCHNAPEIFPWRDDPLTGQWGVEADYGTGLAYVTPTFSTTAQVGEQLDLCYKCHSSFTNQPDSSVYRDTDFTDFKLDDGTPLKQVNLAFQLNEANSSFHPLDGAGTNVSLNLCKSLESAFDLDCSSKAAAKTSLENIRIKCTDCHNNNDVGDTGVRGPSSNYTGDNPTGPHGSDNQWTLRAPYNRDLTYPRTGFATDPGNSDLCFTCHDKARLTGAWTSNFAGGDSAAKASLHTWHLTGGSYGVSPIRARCADCHYNTHGNASPNNTYYLKDPLINPGNRLRIAPGPYWVSGLINFAPHVLGTAESKPLMYLSNCTPLFGPDSKVTRTCILTCHNGSTNAAVSMDNYWGGAGRADDHTYDLCFLLNLGPGWLPE